MANILNISDVEFTPVRSGDQKTTFELCRYLASKGHTLVIVNIRSDEKISNVQEPIEWVSACYNIQSPLFKKPQGDWLNLLRKLYLKVYKRTVTQPFILTQAEIKKIDDIILHEKVDTLIIHRAHLGRYVRFFEKQETLYKILQAHDLQYLRDDRFQKFKGTDISTRLAKHITDEIGILEMFDIVIDLADYEAKDLIQRGMASEKIYSRGTPVSYMDHCPLGKNVEYDLLFVGGNLYQNRVALNWFLEKVWPSLVQKGYKFAIAGRICHDLEPQNSQEDLILLGEFEDVGPIYSNCKMVVAPIVVGSGVKVKVVEAFMNSKVVLTNRLGIEGVSVENGKEYVHCEDPKEWIEAIENLINDETALASIGKNAWFWAVKNATVENVYGELEKMIRYE